MNLTVGTVCDRGLNPKRPVNQDRFLCLPERGLFAAFDGVGGQRAGEIASQTAAETIEEALDNLPADSSPERIRRAIEFANRDIFELAESTPEYRTMATTVALLHLDGDHATIAHVGDSRVYRFENGRLHRETIDHTDWDDEKRAGNVLSPDESPEGSGNVINRALGVEPEVDVEIKTLRVRPGTAFLLCTDGVYRHLRDAEIGRVLGEQPTPQLAADELKRIVHERGANDNLTAVVVRIGQKAAARSAGKAVSTPAKKKNKIRVDVVEPFGSDDGPAADPVALKSGGRSVSKRLLMASDDGPATEPVALKSGGRSVSKRLLMAMIGIVLLGGAFYAGLRVADGTRNPAAEAPILVTDPLRYGRDALEIGDRQKALMEFEAILKRDPQNAAAHYWMGRTLLERREYSAASESFRQAIRLDPEMADAYLYAAAACEAEGKKDRAMEMLKEYGRRRP